MDMFDPKQPQATRWQAVARMYHEQADEARRRWERDQPYVGSARIDYEDAVSARAHAFKNQFAWRHGSLSALDDPEAC